MLLEILELFVYKFTIVPTPLKSIICQFSIGHFKSSLNHQQEKGGIKSKTFVKFLRYELSSDYICYKDVYGWVFWKKKKKRKRK